MGDGGSNWTSRWGLITEDVGLPALQAHLNGVIALMRAAPSLDSFKRSLQHAFPKIRELGLYDTERIELRAGDRIRWTRNRTAPPARFGHTERNDIEWRCRRYKHPLS